MVRTTIPSSSRSTFTKSKVLSPSGRQLPAFGGYFSFWSVGTRSRTVSSFPDRFPERTTFYLQSSLPDQLILLALQGDQLVEEAFFDLDHVETGFLEVVGLF